MSNYCRPLSGKSLQRDCAEVAYLRMAYAARAGFHGGMDALVRRSSAHVPDGRGTGSRKAQGTAGKGFPPRFSPLHPLFVSRPGRVHRPDGAVRMGGMGQSAPGPYRQERLPARIGRQSVARRFSGRRCLDLQHRFLAASGPGRQNGGVGGCPGICRAVGGMGPLSGVAVALRFLRPPFPAARPADGDVRLPAECPVLAGAGPVPPALLRHGGANHVQCKRLHSRHAFLHLPGFGAHAPALDPSFVCIHRLLFPPRGPGGAASGGLPVVPAMERRPRLPAHPVPSLLSGSRPAGGVLPPLLWGGKRAILPYGHTALLYASGRFSAHGYLFSGIRPVLLAGFPEESPLHLYAGNRTDSAFLLRERGRQRPALQGKRSGNGLPARLSGFHLDEAPPPPDVDLAPAGVRAGAAVQHSLLLLFFRRPPGIPGTLRFMLPAFFLRLPGMAAAYLCAAGAPSG